MTTTPLDPRPRILEAAQDAVVARMRADVALLRPRPSGRCYTPRPRRPTTPGSGRTPLFGEVLVPLAGEGAPLVAEFAPAELAAVLGWSTESVKQLMGDALELVHRLPRLWNHVTELRMPVALARFAAEQTRDLDRHAAHDADLMLACNRPP